MMNFQILTPISFASDERGWSIDPVMRGDFPDGDVKNLHLVSILPGHVRGNHYHETLTEYALFIAGDGLLAVLDRQTGERQEILISTSDGPALVKLPAGIVHAIKNTGVDTLYVLNYSNADHPSEGLDQVREVIFE